MKIFGFFVDQSKRLMALGVIVLILLTLTIGVVSGRSGQVFTKNDCPACLELGMEFPSDTTKTTIGQGELRCIYGRPTGYCGCSGATLCIGDYTDAKAGEEGFEFWRNTFGDENALRPPHEMIKQDYSAYDKHFACVKQFGYSYWADGVFLYRTKYVFWIRIESPDEIDAVKAFKALEKCAKAVVDKKEGVSEENCENYCKEKFDKKKPADLTFIRGRGEYPFCYCICMDEKTGDEVICWKEDWDCEKYCSKIYKNKQWDSISEWPDCLCICKQGYEEREKVGCLPCNEICKRKGGEHYIEDKGKSKPNSCACKCEDGYDDSYGEKCEKVECPPNSTNVADLSSPCPKDRKLNRHCCCDAGYVKWYEVCIKEEDVPGKVVCGKWGCQEGEDCINCPEDCGCIAPEICDPFSKYANPETGCSPKVAYIFISSEIDTYEYYWILYKINHIRKYYRSLGYKTITVRVNNLDDVVDKLSHPSTKAIAYFGHAIEPSIEYSDATGIGNLMYQTLYSMYQYPASGINDEEARRRASERSARPNLDYAYIHTCSSLDDPSLADYLLHSGGTYWGEKDKLYPVEWLDEYVKP